MALQRKSIGFLVVYLAICALIDAVVSGFIATLNTMMLCEAAEVAGTTPIAIFTWVMTFGLLFILGAVFTFVVTTFAYVSISMLNECNQQPGTPRV